MEAIRHLTEVLKSQVALYSELSDLITLEKEAISTWAVNKTVEIAKKKEDILRREHIQQEARKLLLEKIAAEYNTESMTITDVLKAVNGTEYAETLEPLCDHLIGLIKTIHMENVALRMLYNTNSKMIHEFFTQAGLVENVSTYAPGAKSTTRLSTIHRIG